MLRAEDLLWSVHGQEREVRERHDRDVAVLTAALEATRELAALEANPNFQAFVARLEVILADAMRKLRDCAGVEADLYRLQGQCQSLQRIIDLCRNFRERGQRLALKLQAAQDARDKAVLPDGRVVPQGLSGIVL